MKLSGRDPLFRGLFRLTFPAVYEPARQLRVPYVAYRPEKTPSHPTPFVPMSAPGARVGCRP